MATWSPGTRPCAWSAAPTARASSWISRQLDAHRAVRSGHRRPDERHPGSRVGSELQSLDGRQRFVVAHPPDASPRARRTRCVRHIVYAPASDCRVCQARTDGARTPHRRRPAGRRSAHPAERDPRWPRHRGDRGRRRLGRGDRRLQRPRHLAGLHRSAVQRCRRRRPHDRSDIDRHGCRGTPPLRRHVVPADGGHQPGDEAPCSDRGDAQRAAVATRSWAPMRSGCTSRAR